MRIFNETKRFQYKIDKEKRAKTKNTEEKEENLY